MVSKRLSKQDGHARKFLVVVDETPESERAICYASRRAKNTGGSLILLFVIDNSEFQNFLGVGEVMRAESEERAHNILATTASDIRIQQGIESELIVKEGFKADEITKLIDEDQDIAILVLAAGAGHDGPGPLIQSIAGHNAAFSIPVIVIPDTLSDEDIEAVT